jgi:hypothetical protein
MNEKLYNNIWGSVEDSVWRSLRDCARVSMEGSVQGSVWFVRDSVRRSVWENVQGSVFSKVRIYNFDER